MIVLTHLHPSRAFRVAGHFERLEDEARALGLPSRRLQYRDHDVEASLDMLPAAEWAYLNSGFMELPLYTAVYDALAKKNIRMLNNPKQNQTLMRFELFYPKVTSLTAKSFVVRGLLDVEEALATISLPAFVKGSIVSSKESGWQACIVSTKQELEARASELGDGQILVVRELLDLRRTGKYGDFPTSREYRVYLFNNTVLGHGYFWEGNDPWGELTKTEESKVLELARETSTRVGCPLIAVDVGQIEDGSWKVIEVGDPQHTGIAHMPRNLFFEKLSALL